MHPSIPSSGWFDQMRLPEILSMYVSNEVILKENVGALVWHDPRCVHMPQY